MKQSDLFRQYANILDMCEGTTLKPYKCIKNQAGQTFLSTPNFLGNPSDYTFAIAVINNKPIFNLEVE